MVDKPDNQGTPPRRPRPVRGDLSLRVGSLRSLRVRSLRVRSLWGGRVNGLPGSSPREGPPRGKRWRGRRETGTATVWTVAVMGVLWTVVLGLVAAGGARVARHRAQAAADLSALAVAAKAVPMGEEACRRGRTVAEANHARLVRCAVVGTIADVVVATDASVPPLGLRVVTARARAGTAGPDSLVEREARAAAHAVKAGGLPS